MSKLTIIASILAKKSQKELVKSEVLKLVEPTRKEKGCINYDLHQDNNNENLFIFHENWESEELLKAHTQSAHFIAFGEATKDAIEEFIVNKMTQVK